MWNEPRFIKDSSCDVDVHGGVFMDTVKILTCSHIKTLVFHCFLSDSCRVTMGARLPGAHSSVTPIASTEKFPGNTDAHCHSEGVLMPSAFSTLVGRL